QATQTDERVRRVLQPRVAPAVRELQSLRDEFDLAYAAAPQLDVIAARFVRVLAVDLLLGEAHVCERLLDGARAHVDCWAHALGEAREELTRARGGARANQCLQFPRLRRLAIITQG